jgi:hypothetical protein
MGYRRDLLVFLLILCALGGVSAVAAPTCQPNPLSPTYLAPAFTCTLGPFTVKSFFFSETAGGLNPNLISVNPINTGTQIGFLIQGNFTATPGQAFTYIFSYFIDPPPPIIRGQQVDLDPTGLVTLQTDLCMSAFPCPGGQALGTLNVNTGSPTAQMPLALTNMLGVQNTLTLDGSGGLATSQGFDNITLLTPEPAAILLTASGLLGLFTFRARAKIRQVLLQLRS